MLVLRHPDLFSLRLKGQMFATLSWDSQLADGRTRLSSGHVTGLLYKIGQVGEAQRGGVRRGIRKNTIQLVSARLYVSALFYWYSFNNSDHHGTNSSSRDYDSTLEIFLLFFFFFFFFLLSLLAHLYGISATRRHLRHFFGSLYLLFVSG